MNFKWVLIFIVLFISLGVFVSSRELVFPTGEDIRISIDLINGSGLWNETGLNLYPHAANLNLRVPTLVSCDTIDTDGSGVFSCGSDDATGAGIYSNFKLENVSNLSLIHI